MDTHKPEITPQQLAQLIATLQNRFTENENRHKGIEWAKVSEHILNKPYKLWSLYEMERTGGEPDVLTYQEETNEFLFFDCSPESPKGRRSLCYDRAALESRKEHPPQNNVINMAQAMGIELLTEEQYRYLQQFGVFDAKTSSWITTPENIRMLGGAIFCDYRYGTVFVYHNGASSYYASRGFRGMLRI